MGILAIVRTSTLTKTSTTSIRVQVSKSSPFSSVQRAQDPENFLWDLERYFHVAHDFVIQKNQICVMYLNVDVKIQWHVHVALAHEVNQFQMRMGGIEAKDKGATLTQQQFLESSRCFSSIEIDRNSMLCVGYLITYVRGDHSDGGRLGLLVPLHTTITEL